MRCRACGQTDFYKDLEAVLRRVTRWWTYTWEPEEEDDCVPGVFLREADDLLTIDLAPSLTDLWMAETE